MKKNRSKERRQRQRQRGASGTPSSPSRIPMEYTLTADTTKRTPDEVIARKASRPHYGTISAVGTLLRGRTKTSVGFLRILVLSTISCCTTVMAATVDTTTWLSPHTSPEGDSDMDMHRDNATTNSSISSLRENVNSEVSIVGDSKWERIPVIRRIYGPDGVGVRREINRLEESMERYQTGLRSDPSHLVPYENHPYEDGASQRQRRRHLDDQTGDDYVTLAGEGEFASEASDAEASGNRFQPMRIVFETKALDDMRDVSNSDRIDWYIREILPRTADFWSSTLSVVPVSGNLRMTMYELDSLQYCGDAEFTRVPDEHKTQGVPNADLILYVSGSASERFCPARTLAVAVPCNFDQFDRPTGGAINVCLENIELDENGEASTEIIEDYVDVTIHEVGHVLGHSSNSYRFFWDPESGEPRTPRPFEPRTVTCVDGTEKTLILPAENTMQFNAENGVRYASIVTPKVRTVARNQFDCPSLEGARLENQPTRSESCTGDHWDERLFYPEALSGVISPTTNILSPLTLALMEDSGWYKANYTNGRTSPWGLGQGCEFINEPCLQQGAAGVELPEWARGYFCDIQSEKACSSEHTHKMACTVIDYEFYVPQVLPPSEYQYFLDTPSKGGPRQADYCPVYGSTYENWDAEQLDCRNADNAGPVNIYSEVYGQDSKCISSTAGRGLCYRTACVQDSMTVRINVLGVWYTCDRDFMPISVRVGQGLLETTLVCPRLSQACPDLFCPFNCAGRGTCNYSNFENGTIRPKCECFDPNDNTEACSDSLIPDGGFLEDSSGLFDNLEENFFDPLIAVFVDPPELWTTASWAWAGGLIAIFVILLVCICSSFLPENPKSRQYRRR